MKRRIARWGSSTVQTLVLAAVAWSTVIHSAYSYVTPTVLFVLLGSALCIWASSRLLLPSTGAEGSGSHGEPNADAPAAAVPHHRPITPLAVQSLWIWVPLCLLCLLTLASVIPLPASLIEVLSPSRAAWARKLSEALPDLKTRWLTLSADSDATQRAFPYFLFPLMAFVLGNSLASSRRRVRGIVTFLLCLALAEGLYGLAEQLSGHRYVLWIADRSDDARGTFINRNHFAATLSLFVPMAIGWLYFRASYVVQRPTLGDILTPTSWDLLHSRRGLWLVVPPVLVLGIIQSHSRGAFSSMLLGLALMVLAGWRSRVSRAFAVISIVLSIVILGYAMSGDYEKTIKRFGEISELTGKGGRAATWSDSLGIVRDYPLFGIGLGNFADVYRHYQTSGSKSAPYQAHNEWLEGLLTFGWPGMGLLVVAVAVCFVKSFRIVRRARRDQPWLLGAWAGLLALMVHSFVEFNFHMPNIAITAALLMGLVLGYERLCPTKAHHNLRRNRPRIPGGE
jgi:O-antigen ligase